MNHRSRTCAGDELISVSREVARELKRAQVRAVKKGVEYDSSGSYVAFRAPCWIANALAQCVKRRDRRAVLILLRRAQDDANLRDALKAAVMAELVLAFVRSQVGGEITA